MHLYKEVLIRVLEKEEINTFFPNLNIDAREIVKLECYRALQKIKAIIEDDSLEDQDCFRRIEEIICVYENLGSDGGNRHDFG